MFDPRGEGPRSDEPREDIPRDDLPREDEAEDWFSGLVPPPIGDPEGFSAGEVLREAASRPAGLGLLELLGSVDPAGFSADEVVTFAQCWQQAASWLAGQHAAALDTANRVLVDHARREVSGLGSRFVCAEQVVVTELAAALRLGEVTVGHRVETAGCWPGRGARCATP